MITVLSSRRTTGEFVGKPGYNVLKVPDDEWSYALNGEWLGKALTRGDRLLLTDNPAELRQRLDSLGKSSVFLENELPGLHTWFGTKNQLLIEGIKY